MAKKKSYNVRPTDLHKKAFKKLSENPRNKGKALLAAGYSKSMAEKPSDVLNSKGFRLLLDEEGLDDSKLAKTHKAVLNKKEVILKNNNKTGKIEKITTGQPHSDVNKALDMAYKLKGYYAPTEINQKTENLNLNINLDEKTSKQLAQIALSLKEQI